MKILKVFKNKDFLIYLILILVTIVGFIFTYRAWKYNYLSYPLVYKHDGIESLKLIKHLTETGNHWQSSSRLGAPFNSNLYVDFPTADQALIFIIKSLTIFSSNPFLIYNIYILITYILVSVTAYVVLRKLKLNEFLAIVGSLLFSFLPYHQIRVVVGHIFLIGYFTVPLMVYLAMLLIQKKFNLRQYTNLKRLIKLLFVCCLIGSIGTAYYAFFAIGLWLIAGLVGLIWNQNKQAFFGALTISLIVGLVVIVNILPSWIYQSKYGKNIIIKRDPIQIEEFGLRLSRFLMPLPGSKPIFISNLLVPYYKNIQHEQYQYLGLIGVIGFIYLIKELISRKEYDQTRAAAVFITGLTLWAVSGGLAYLFGFFISASIRSYGRISIILAFICIWAILNWWQKFSSRYKNKRLFLINAAFLFIVAVSLLEQTQSIDPHNNFWDIKKTFDENKTIVQEIEQIMPSGSMIFQLPYMKYPEARGQCMLDSYDLFVGYLHSKNLKWSFGAIEGREEANWYAWASSLPIQKMLPTIAMVGFNGIYIDTSGCINGWEWQEKIAKITNGQLYTSSNQKIILMDISEYAQQIRGSLSEAELEKTQQSILSPVTWQLANGFKNMGRQPGGISVDMGHEGTILLNNPNDQVKPITINFQIKSKKKDHVRLEAIYDNNNTFYETSPGHFQVTITIQVKPKISRLMFKMQAGDSYYLSKLQVEQNLFR